MTALRARVALMATCSTAVMLCSGILIGCAQRSDQGAAVNAASAQPNSTSDIGFLDESMLIGEGSVPPLIGTSWGSMVAVPRGPEPQVSPAGCELFLSQGAAMQKGMAIRSSKNASIGVSLSLPVQRADLAALFARCEVFTFTAPGAESSVTLEPWDVAGLPEGTISTLMHCRTLRADETLEWDIAAIIGFHRGVLVMAQYTPGPQGGEFDADLSSQLGEVYLAQIAKLG